MAFRTQKISQMTPKGADLEATDLIEVSTIESGSYVTRSITGQELIDAIPAPTGFVPTSRTLTINGVTQDLSADRTFTIATGLTVGTTPIASGTNGRVLFQGTGNVLQQSSSLFWDNANERLGVGTSTPAQTFQVYRNTSAGYLASFNSGATLNTNASLTVRIENANLPSLQALNPGAGAFNTFALNPLGGNILIGTTTDAGFRLDVNGTARVSGLVTATLSNYNSTHSGNTTRGFYIVNSADSIVRGGIEYDGTNAFVQLAGRFANGAPFFRQDGGNGNISFLRNNVEFGRFFGTGNLLIQNGGTYTDAGFRLDVNGDTRLGSGTTTGTTEVRGSNIVIFRVNDVLNNNNMGIYKNATSGYLFESSSANQLSYGYASNYWMSWRNSTKSIAIASTGSEPTPAATAIFDLQSTTKGFLPPRMTTTQKNAIASPATGLQVYDTTLNQMSYYNGTTWTNI
jgi:hypothetical protein